VLGLVPQALVIKHHLIPTSLSRNTLTLVMADPSNLVAINEIKFLTGYDVKIAVASPAAIAAAIDRHYNNDANFDEVLSQLGNENVELIQDEDDVDLNELEKATEERRS
jgi:type IV pilus assembly protein PilB